MPAWSTHSHVGSWVMNGASRSPVGRALLGQDREGHGVAGPLAQRVDQRRRRPPAHRPPDEHVTADVGRAVGERPADGRIAAVVGVGWWHGRVVVALVRVRDVPGQQVVGRQRAVRARVVVRPSDDRRTRPPSTRPRVRPRVHLQPPRPRGSIAAVTVRVAVAARRARRAEPRNSERRSRAAPTAQAIARFRASGEPILNTPAVRRPHDAELGDRGRAVVGTRRPSRRRPKRVTVFAKLQSRIEAWSSSMQLDLDDASVGSRPPSARRSPSSAARTPWTVGARCRLSWRRSRGGRGRVGSPSARSSGRSGRGGRGCRRRLVARD